MSTSFLPKFPGESNSCKESDGNDVTLILLEDTILYDIFCTSVVVEHHVLWTTFVLSKENNENRS